jgi:sodium-dependent dicarboxylate transporter 2/3/5
MSSQADETAGGWLGRAGKLGGVLLFLLIWLGPPAEGLPPAAQRLGAVTVLMAVWWVTQAAPMAVTSMVPLAAFPLLGIQGAEEVSQAYINANVFLFLGGFIIAMGIEKWGLHRRMALHIVRVIGSGPKRVVLGFMLATAFLSMWISNTATALLMLPIGLALLTSIGELQAPSEEAARAERRLTVALMLAIAYSASLGGMTTLVGTPTNVAFQQIWAIQFPDAPKLSAGEWMAAFVPMGFVFLLGTWLILTWRLPALAGAERLNRGFFTERIRRLGRPSRQELAMLVIFAATALLWIFRKPLRIGNEPLVPGWGPIAERFLLNLGTESDLAARAVDDSTVAMAMALVMFFVPAGRDDKERPRYLMDWETAERLPWGILLLIGGGFALAAAFDQTGLSNWVGARFAGTVRDWPVWLLVVATCTVMTLLTEFTTNVATVSAVLPILAGTTVSLGIDPRLILIPAALSASCAFMLPIATPPNAIVFSSGKVRIADMVYYGIALNVLGVVLITATAFLVLVPQLDIVPTELPPWAVRTP